jgi:mersacidin/lichenicidin family type 2 lantibiotic
MSDLNIIKAWKDVNYRRTLTAKQLAQVPANPAGTIENSESRRPTFITPICTRIISAPCDNC